MRDSFILYTSISEVLADLTDEEKGQLFQVIIDYQATGEVPEMSKIIKVVFTPIRQQLDQNEEKWQRTKEARSRAGKIAAEARWGNAERIEMDASDAERIAEDASDAKRISDIAKITVNVNDNVNVNGNKKKAKESVDDVISEAPAQLESTLYDFVDMRKRIKAPMTPRAMRLLLNKLNDLSEGDIDESIAILEQSIISGWKSVYPLKDKGRSKSFVDIAREMEAQGYATD